MYIEYKLEKRWEVRKLGDSSGTYCLKSLGSYYCVISTSFFQTGSCSRVQATLNFSSFCLHLLNTGITCVQQHWLCILRKRIAFPVYAWEGGMGRQTQILSLQENGPGNIEERKLKCSKHQSKCHFVYEPVVFAWWASSSKRAKADYVMGTWDRRKRVVLTPAHKMTTRNCWDFAWYLQDIWVTECSTKEKATTYILASSDAFCFALEKLVMEKVPGSARQGH